MTGQDTAMSAIARHYRREAELVEQVARCISLQCDRQGLLEKARSLRRRADEIEVEAAVSTGSRGAPPSERRTF